MNTRNKLIAIILATALFSFASAEVRTVDYLQYRGGVAYEVNGEKPFTGKSLLKIPSRILPPFGGKSEENWKDGEQHGAATSWDKKAKQAKFCYQNGKTVDTEECFK